MAFGLSLLYLVIFLLRPAERFPILEPLHVERIVGILALIACFQRWQQRQGSRTEGAGRPDPVTQALLLFLGSIILSIPTSVWLGNSVDWLVNYLKAVALFIMIRLAVDSDRRLRIFLWTWLLLAGWNVLEPVLEAAQGRYGAYDSTFGGFERLRGTTEAGSDPNSLAAAIVSTLPFIYYLLGAEAWWPARLFLLSLGGVSLVGLFLTGSRTGVVGFLALLLLLLLGARRKLVGSLLVLAMVAGAWAFLDDTLRVRYASVIDVLDEESRDSSAAQRDQALKDGWEIFQDRPITGVGIGNFTTARGERFGRWKWPHNLYLQALTEVGVIGFACFASFLAVILAMTQGILATAAGREDSSGRLHRALARAIRTSVIARLVLGLFGHSLYGYYWLLLGGLAVVTRKLTEGATAADPMREQAEPGLSFGPQIDPAR